ncbi:MAG: hypothetical protein IJ112_03835 [Oscillospiraceae bacterium]|nr:hypothetical protein [Oscillospiraceae bacterium]
MTTLQTIIQEYHGVLFWLSFYALVHFYALFHTKQKSCRIRSRQDFCFVRLVRSEWNCLLMRLFVRNIQNKALIQVINRTYCNKSIDFAFGCVIFLSDKGEARARAETPIPEKGMKERWNVKSHWK